MSTTPNSSVESSSAMEEDNDYDTFCFTPCRRDANCNCKICQASINATLDLLPLSAQRSSITKFSSSKPSPPQTPLFLNPSAISTPKSQTSCLIVTPPPLLKSTDLPLTHQKKTEFRFRLMTMKCVLVVLCLSLVGKLGFSFVNSRVMITKLSPEIVRNLSEKSLGLGFRDVKEQLGFLNNELQYLLGSTEASPKIPNWEVVQDGLILRSQCQLYKSRIEEVSIWGWPLQTSGLVTTDFASRSFTVLSGRVTEWSNGESSGLVRTANSSWEQGKWSTSVWRLDENTWIVEYKRSFVFDETRLVSSVMEFLRFKMMKSFQWMKQLWKFSDANHLAPT